MRIRFSLYFIVGLFIWIISFGVFIMVTLDFIFPNIGLTSENTWYDLIVFFVFLLIILVSSVFCAWFLGNPLWFILTWIKQLTRGEYAPPSTKRNIYNKKGKLRLHYKLYENVINNIQTLALHLNKAESERLKLEEEKKDWLAGISHDVKTPLTYITGYTALLLNEEYSWTEEEKHTFIEEISQKAHHIESLIHDLNLSFQMNNVQAPIPLNKSEVNLVEFLRALIADISNDPRALSYLSFHSTNPFINISIDQRLIYRAIQNLIMNAILHNPEETCIDVFVIVEQEQFVTITIRDNGVGMDQETLNNLFNKYYRGTPTSSDFSSGLGMSIVKSLIIAHGGNIDVSSEITKGTIVQVHLPLN
ncbi:sensor histidine kinase [Alkalihalobacterium bogoriense]|uniref:sensor histidine kinase n=1 Tax=Alkalihalobacterium bogoriense TaxID=246272 RepID=UPI0004797C3E|nr:HAMP domain-containing sensor histidine kinase [Alkalihalobacterium bogoriense]